MLQTISEEDAHMLRFDSQAEVVNYIDPTAYRSQGAKFVGEDLPTFDDAALKANSPWPDGQAVIEQFVERLRAASLPMIKDRKRYTEWSFDDGDEVDMDRLQAGLPHMRRQIREAGNHVSEMTVIIDTTTPCFKKSDNILWRGAVAIALTHIMEERGYRVELWVTNGSRLFMDDSRPVCTAACLKRCSDPLDVSTLIGTVSGWFYRSMVFALLDTICKKLHHPVNWGYGSCYTPRPKDLDVLSRDPLRVYASGVFSFNGAVDMIVGELERVQEISNSRKPEDAAQSN